VTGATRERSAIVLAGGSSRRFGSDKLGAIVRGRPMLDHAILAVASVADEVLVAGLAGPERLLDARGTTLRRIPDAHADAGPLAALAGALAEVRHATVIVVAGDMPDLVPPVLALLAATVDEGGAQAALLAADGRAVPLPAALDVAFAGPAAREVLDAGASSLRALLERLTVAVVDEAAWRALDPDGTTLRDVDEASDLQETERRPRSRRASCGG
jgi:molybdopterin-guanine dinucleotide biosynthesis protein A